MPEPFTTHKANVAAAWLHLKADFHNAVNHLESLAVQLDGENCPNSAQSVRNAVVDFRLFEAHIAGGTPSMRITLAYCLNWIDDNWPTDGELYELTAIKICEAWAKNSFEERALTIAFIDRMRQLIWDEPFYIAWAARPEQSGD